MCRRRPRGFTLLELMVVVAIIGIVAGVVGVGFLRARPRASFTSTSAELQSLVHYARQEALSSGLDVAVMIFPGYVSGGGIGRIIVLRDDSDPNQSIFATGATLTFGGYDPSLLQSTPNGKVLTSLDLPSGVIVGPTSGMPDAPPFPYSAAATGSDCPFCSGTGVARRGAIVFDARGRPTFRDGNGLVDLPSGASITITAQDLTATPASVTSTLVIIRPQGLLRTFLHG